MHVLFVPLDILVGVKTHPHVGQWITDRASLERRARFSPAQCSATLEILERIELLGSRVVAIHPRGDYAWLLGMFARKRGDVGMVGARGFEPPASSSRTMRATWLRHAPTGHHEGMGAEV